MFLCTWLLPPFCVARGCQWCHRLGPCCASLPGCCCEVASGEGQQREPYDAKVSRHWVLDSADLSWRQFGGWGCWRCWRWWRWWRWATSFLWWLKSDGPLDGMMLSISAQSHVNQLIWVVIQTLGEWISSCSKVEWSNVSQRGWNYDETLGVWMWGNGFLSSQYVLAMVYGAVTGLQEIGSMLRQAQSNMTVQYSPSCDAILTC